jgi:hypothetical protein
MRGKVNRYGIQIEDLPALLGAPEDLYAQGYSGAQTLQAFEQCYADFAKDKYGLKPIESSKFLDLGSGHGAIVAQAQIMGFAFAGGIEIDPHFAELSKFSLTGLGFKANIYTGDYFSQEISNLTLENHKLEDIDYFYVYEQSTSHNNLEHGQAVFEYFFAKYAKPGAVLIPVSFSPYSSDADYLAQYGCEKLDLNSELHIIRKL